MINGDNVLFEHCQIWSRKGVAGKFIPSSDSTREKMRTHSTWF